MINFLAAEIVDYFYVLLLPFVRISAFILSAPVFSLSAFNLRFRLIVATVLTVLAVDLVSFDTQSLALHQLISAVLAQLLLGVASGFILQIINGAITVAGQAISNSMGLGMANLMDPTFGNVPVISQFLVVLSTLIFLVADGHLILIQILMQSFIIFPVGEMFSLSIIYEVFIEWTPLLFMGWTSPRFASNDCFAVSQCRIRYGNEISACIERYFRWFSGSHVCRFSNSHLSFARNNFTNR